MKNTVLLAGAGPMAAEYAKVLKELSVKIIVAGRGNSSADTFRQKTGITIFTGGIRKFLEGNHSFDAAIVATGMETLAPVTMDILGAGCKKILVEKPAGMNSGEVGEVARFASAKGADVFVAYNRRFYAAVHKALEIISDDGGVKSFTFEFTERSHLIEKLEKFPGIKQNWFFGNSTHVIDLAFFIGGVPAEMKCLTSGELSWHKPAVFSGSGLTGEGALFSYHANWHAPGRWGVEIFTSRSKLILRPLETLQVQRYGSDAIERVELNDAADKKFKPGLLKQTEAFLQPDYRQLCNIHDHAGMCKVYDRISGITV